MPYHGRYSGGYRNSSGDGYRYSGAFGMPTSGGYGGSRSYDRYSGGRYSGGYGGGGSGSSPISYRTGSSYGGSGGGGISYRTGSGSYGGSSRSRYGGYDNAEGRGRDGMPYAPDPPDARAGRYEGRSRRC